MSMMDTHNTLSGPMNPTGIQAASFEAWQALVAPGDVFRRPHEVLAHPQLSRAEKRAILASWASDACALENAPALRCLTGTRAEPVPLDTVLAALAALDRDRRPTEVKRSPVPLSTRRRPRPLMNFRRYIRPGRKDDDDPPPNPATAMPRPRPRMPAGALR